MMTTSRTNTVTAKGPAGRMTLGDLRWLVNQLLGADDDLEVRVKVDPGDPRDQRDIGSTTMTADVPDRPVHPSGFRPRAVKDSPQA